MTATAYTVPAIPGRVDNQLPAYLVDQARSYAQEAQAPNTRRAYAADFKDFRAFCDEHALCPLPAAPQTVVAYITNRAALHKISTLNRRLVGITKAHQERGLESPTAHEMVRRVRRGIARVKGSLKTRKTAITLDVLRAMLLAVEGDSIAALRDRAILLLGFAAALRRSEIVALEVSDLAFDRRGLLLSIRHSKTDQLGEGATIAIPYVDTASLCAVRAVRRYLDVAGITSGLVFRSLSTQRKIKPNGLGGRDVANLIQRLAQRARISGDYSGHSLRAGLATSAAHAKVSLDAIARTTRHKSLSTLMGYVRPAQAFDDVALSAIIA